MYARGGAWQHRKVYRSAACVHKCALVMSLHRASKKTCHSGTFLVLQPTLTSTHCTRQQQQPCCMLGAKRSAGLHPTNQNPALTWNTSALRHPTHAAAGQNTSAQPLSSRLLPRTQHMSACLVAAAKFSSRHHKQHQQQCNSLCRGLIHV